MAAFSVSPSRAGRLAAIGTLLAVALVVPFLSGCTTWAPKKNPAAFQDTTSAEQYERIFWKDVRHQKWKKIGKVLAPNVAYTSDGKVVSRNQIIPSLESLNLSDFLISDLTVEPNGADMTVTYRIQIQRPNHPPESFVALSVWQHIRHGMILIAHSSQPAAEPPAGH